MIFDVTNILELTYDLIDSFSTDVVLWIILAFSTLTGGLASISYLYEKLITSKGKGETIEQRISKFTSSLNEATKLIDEVEIEIKKRHLLAEKLQDDINTYNKLAELKQPEVEAVAQLFRGELRIENRKSFLQNTITNFIFFMAGIIVTIILK